MRVEVVSINLASFSVLSFVLESASVLFFLLLLLVGDA